MADNRINLPSSGGGITRFSDSSGSKFQIKPGHVIILLILVTLLEILLHTFGNAWFGITN
jgi:preprotein translocase subunit Sec61beta